MMKNVWVCDICNKTEDATRAIALAHTDWMLPPHWLEIEFHCENGHDHGQSSFEPPLRFKISVCGECRKDKIDEYVAKAEKQAASRNPL